MTPRQVIFSQLSPMVYIRDENAVANDEEILKKDFKGSQGPP